MGGDRSAGNRALRGAVYGLAMGAAGLANACGGQTSSGSDGSECGTLTACGGNLEGTWTVDSICSTPQPKSQSPNVDGGSFPAACQNGLTPNFSEAKYEPIDLTLTFSGAEFHETGTVQLTDSVTFTSACLSALGSPPADVSACQSLAAREGYSTCNPVSGACACSGSGRVPIDVTGPYRVQGGEIVWYGNETFTSSYWVSGDSAALVGEFPLLESGLSMMGRIQLTRAANGAD